MREGLREGSDSAGGYRPAGAGKAAGGLVPLFRGDYPARTAPPAPDQAAQSDRPAEPAVGDASLSAKPASIELRPYQKKAVDDLREAMRRHRRALLQLPTGGGKTIVFASIAPSAAQKGSRVLILVHRKELVRQTVEKLQPFGVTPGIVGKTAGWDLEPVAVGMVITTAKRELPAYNLIIVDEAHHAVSKSWEVVLDKLPCARVLGVTATPQRLDGKGLGECFDVMVQGPTVRELTKGGFLAPIVAWGIEDANVRGLRLVGGNWKAADLEAVLGPFTERALAEWSERAIGVQTIAFCCSVAHAEFVAARWREAGFSAACVHGGMEERLRDRIIAEFGAGKLTLLTCCELIDEGFDVPEVGCVLQLRPTASITKHFQQIGRAMRPKADGSPCVVIDLVGNIDGAGHRKGLGLPDEVVAWTLDGKPKRDEGERGLTPDRGDPTIEALAEGRIRLLRSKLADCRWWGEAEGMVERPEDYLILQRYFPKPTGGRYRDVWIVRRCAERFFSHLPFAAALRSAGIALGKSRMVENSLARGHGWTVQEGEKHHQATDAHFAGRRQRALGTQPLAALGECTS
ncbi:DEAD/DEAH box helicase [Geminicoccus flavidas]|uniref:DEAD/DEAH box helicase n=1 Tax=Geminicoccus flavidas TaxID=2506407 RepID=UPI0021062436|nr:DEAD/DEAH box helicase [Geminicoccus flavidas]